MISCLEELLRQQVLRDVEAIEVITPEINLEVLGAIDSPQLRLVAYEHRRGGLLPLARLAQLTLARAWATRPDIIHAHSSIAGGVARLCAPLLPRGARLVYCPHSWSFARRGSRLKNRLLGQVERALSLVTDRIVCVSDHERRDGLAVGISPGKLTVIENGIRRLPPSAAPKPESGPKMLVFAGRLDEQKGFDTYLEALRLLGPGARGLVIGRSIVSDAAPQAVPPNVELLGWQSREAVAEIIAGADALLMPSRWEGFPMVALEAMRVGTAVHASRVGGLEDMIVDGQTGRLFDADDAAAMAAAIRDTDRAELRRQGLAGRARFEALYTADVMDRRVWGVYCELGALRERPRDLRRSLSA